MEYKKCSILKDVNSHYSGSSNWVPLTLDYKGELLEPFNVRWKHTDGTMSPVGSGEKRDGDIMVYWAEKEAGEVAH